MGRNWRPKFKAVCPSCNWTGLRAAVTAFCPKGCNVRCQKAPDRTTTERTPALGGDEAAEQRSAPNLDAGVVGDLVEAAFRSGIDYARQEMEALGDPTADSHPSDVNVRVETFAEASRWLRDLDPVEVREAALKARDAAQGTGGGWVEWAGGENPVPGTMIDTRLRNGLKCYGHANQAMWTHMGYGSDIVAYRVVSHQPAISTDTREPKP